MKLNLHAFIIAIALLVAGCGGGGGGGGAASPNTPPAESPVNSTPPPPPVNASVVTFSGKRDDYSIVRAGDNYTVTDRRNSAVANVDGASINTLRFSDITVNLAIRSKATALGTAGVDGLIELYMAFLGRVPDAAVLAARIDDLAAGKTMVEIADRLYADAILYPERTGYDAAATSKTSDFVTAVYKNTFKLSGASAPTAGTVATWSARIDVGGISRGKLVLEMLAAAHAGSGDLGAPAVVQLLDNRIAVGRYFAAQQGGIYNSADDSLLKTTSIASAVTSADIVSAIGLIGFSDAPFDLL